MPPKARKNIWYQVEGRQEKNYVEGSAAGSTFSQLRIAIKEQEDFQVSASTLILSAKKARSEEHTSELQSRFDLVCRLLLEKKKKNQKVTITTHRNKQFTNETNYHRLTQDIEYTEASQPEYQTNLDSYN